MSATTIFAKLNLPESIIHIDDAVRGKSAQYFCRDCNRELIVVKSEERKRDWHFRHSEGVVCCGSPNRALHDFAVQILMENSQLKVSDQLILDYTDPRKELSFLNRRSDVAILYKGEVVHIEVFVTNDLTKEKIKAFKENKIKCVKIDLSDAKLLKASKEEIVNEVLHNHLNKELIGWESEVKPAPALTSRIGLIDYIVAGVVVVVVFALFAWIIETFLEFVFGRRKVLR